jgi:hypothetical protein
MSDLLSTSQTSTSGQRWQQWLERGRDNDARLARHAKRRLVTLLRLLFGAAPAVAGF